MLKKIRDTLLIIAALSVIGASTVNVKAQSITSSTPWAFAISGTLANCPVASASLAQYCFTSTGLYQAIDATSWTAVGGAAAAPALTINGTTKTLPASFTISASAPNVPAVAATAPNIMSQ
jgi:hypothetical protein